MKRAINSAALSLLMLAVACAGAVETTVYVTRTGEKYHVATCRYLKKSKIPMKLSNAKREYTPCKVCKPPR